MTARLLCLIVFASSLASAEIYRTVDEHGNVVFTDIAPVDRSGQPAPATVTVPPMNTYQPSVPAAPPAQETPDSSGPRYYTGVSILSPSEDETVRDNAGNLQIQVDIDPQLRAGHRLLLVLDGEQTEVQAVNGVFELSNVDRGTHTIAARAVDRQGNVLIESDPTTFSMMRVSVDSSRPIPTPH